MAKNSLILYYEYQEHFELLTNEELGELMRAIFEYEMNGEIAAALNPIQKMAFSFIKKDLDDNRKKRHWGKSHWNWKGGISNENHVIRNSARYKNWRSSVVKRDKFVCRKCGQHTKILHAHHVKKFSEFPELRFDVENGVTLCKKCHDAVHSKGGKL